MNNIFVLIFCVWQQFSTLFCPQKMSSYAGSVRSLQQENVDCDQILKTLACMQINIIIKTFRFQKRQNAFLPSRDSKQPKNNQKCDTHTNQRTNRTLQLFLPSYTDRGKDGRMEGMKTLALLFIIIDVHLAFNLTEIFLR